MSLLPVTEVFNIGIFGGAGFQAAIDTALKDEPIMLLSIFIKEGQQITLGFDEPRLRELSHGLAGLADILLKRTKPNADKTPTAAQMVKNGATFYRATTA